MSAVAAALLLGGRPVPLDGPALEIHEATALDFSFAKGMDGRLLLAGMDVPMPGGRVDPNWMLESRREQWVGELDLVLQVAGPDGPEAAGGRPETRRPRVVVLPRRATLEGFAFLVDQFRAWAGAGALTDPAGRTRIWAELAPRVPGRAEERALVALALLRRALPAFAALHRAPATAPAGRFEWSALERTGGRRVLLRRLHPFDPPRPLEAPRDGRVATLVVEPSPDRAENRFVIGVVRRLLAMARDAGLVVAGFDPGLAQELAETSRALQMLSGEAPWAVLVSGPLPRASFLLRDQPHYRTFRTLAGALDDSLHFSPIPGDPAALGLHTQTLNALFEVWVCQAVRAAVRRRLGLAAPLGAPLPRGATEEAATPAGQVRVSFDRVYPRTGEEIVALTRKRSPDVSVEWWPAGGGPVVMAVDATWSRNPNYHDDKLGYARSLAHGGSDPMFGAPRLCTRRSVVVFPGPAPRVHEMGFDLSLATVSAPPSAEGWHLLGEFMDRALEGVIPPGLQVDGFGKLSSSSPRPGPP